MTTMSRDDDGRVYIGKSHVKVICRYVGIDTYKKFDKYTTVVAHPGAHEGVEYDVPLRVILYSSSEDARQGHDRIVHLLEQKRWAELGLVACLGCGRLHSHFPTHVESVDAKETAEEHASACYSSRSHHDMLLGRPLKESLQLDLSEYAECAIAPHPLKEAERLRSIADQLVRHFGG